MFSKIIYDVIIITDRNYGLYCGFANGILGLKTLILEYKYIETNKKPYIKEDKIWPKETKDDYLISINKLNIPIINVNNIFYHYDNLLEIFSIKYDLDNKTQLKTKYIIYALSINHPHIPSYNNEHNYLLNEKVYIVGEKINYKNKIHKQDFYTGECNFISQEIYKEIHNRNDNITVHSTDLN
jgi:hypothetical protein